LTRIGSPEEAQEYTLMEPIDDESEKLKAHVSIFYLYALMKHCRFIAETGAI